MRRPPPIKVGVKRLSHAEGLALPTYQTAGAAGLDLIAAIDKNRPLTLAPGAFALVPTGLTFALPDGCEAQVRPRSGLAAKFGVTVLNSPGTIDADYRGEVSVILINHSSKGYTINRGDRIAQLVIAPVVRAKLIETSEIPATKRGSGGFGSTGDKGEPLTRKKNAIAARPARTKSATVKRASTKKRTSK